MCCIVFLLCLNIIYRSILPGQGQRTVSTCNDFSTGSHECPIQGQGEYYKNVQIILGELSLKMERISERVQDADEADKIWFNEHYRHLLNVYQNLSFKFDALDETKSGANKFFVESGNVGKYFNDLYQNLSFKLETINEKLQGTDNTTLLLVDSAQNINEKVEAFNHDLQTMHHDFSFGIDEIYRRFTNEDQNLKDSLKGHDQNLQILQQNMTKGIEGIHKKLNDAEQNLKGSLEDHDRTLQIMHQNMTIGVDGIYKKLTDTEKMFVEILKAHDEILHAMHRNTTTEISAIYKNLRDVEQSIKMSAERLDLKVQRVQQNISNEVVRLQNRIASAEQSISVSVQSHVQSMESHMRTIHNRGSTKVCPYDFDYLPEIDQCLKLNTFKNTWNNAHKACPKMAIGGQLVVITSSAKQAAVERYLEHQFAKSGSADCTCPGYKPHEMVAWIGGQTQNPARCDSHFVWKYDGGREVPFSWYFTKWLSGQPDCYGNNENCVMFCSSKDYAWNDLSCTTSLCSVCEI